MSDWKTRITKVQVVKPAAEGGDVGLVLLYPPGAAMGRFHRLGSEAVIGRGTDADIAVDRDSVSRRHARLFEASQQWWVEDLESTNGTYVNDVPVQRSPIHHGDFVRVGSAIFKFLIGGGVEASYLEEIHLLTIMDMLTGAYNKRYFLEFLEREIARCSRYQRPLSLVLFDIDHFKHINDTHGHLTGDYVLKEISRRVLDHVRKEELFARIGGEEFAVVLPETELAGGLQFAEKIRALVADTLFEYEGDSFDAAISAGVVALASQGDQDVMAFIGAADGHLYRAKRSGRNCVIGAIRGGTQSHTWDVPDEVGTEASSKEPTNQTQQLRFAELTPEPDTYFIKHLTEARARGKVSVFAASVLNRRAFGAVRGGGALLDDLDHVLVKAINQLRLPGLLLGDLRDAGAFIVAVPSLRLAAVNGLRTQVEAYFDKERARASLPETSVLCGPSVVVEDPEHAIHVAVQRMLDRHASIDAKRDLPAPIALGLRGLRAQVDPVSEGLALIRVHETITRWLLYMIAADLRHANTASDALNGLERQLGGSTTLGAWTQLLRKTASDWRALDEGQLVLPELRRALFPNGGKQSDSLTTLEEFVEARNSFIHGGIAEDPPGARRLVEAWRPKLENLLAGSLDVLPDLPPVQITDIDVGDDDDDAVYEYEVRRLVGDNLVIGPAMYRSSRRMRRSLVYLVPDAGDRALALDPLVIYGHGSDAGIMEVFFLDTLNNGRFTFMNPRTGKKMDGPSDAEAKRLGRALGKFFDMAKETQAGDA